MKECVELVDEQLACNICGYFVGSSDCVKKNLLYICLEVYTLFVKSYKVKHVRLFFFYH